MKILLLADKFWNSFEYKKISIKQNVIDVLKNNKYKVENRCKKLEIDAKDFEVICYIVKKYSRPSVVIIPPLISPRRPYPIYVYIFAVMIYVLNQDMSQREAARITRLRFSLAKFSASTLCRVIKKLGLKIGKLAVIFNSVANIKPYCDVDDNADEKPYCDSDVNAETVLSELDELTDEKNSVAVVNDEQEAQSSQQVSVRLRLQGVLNKPFIKKFIDNLKNKMPMLSEKIWFKELIDRCCLEYFLLHKQLII